MVKECFSGYGIFLEKKDGFYRIATELVLFAMMMPVVQIIIRGMRNKDKRLKRGVSDVLI